MKFRYEDLEVTGNIHEYIQAVYEVLRQFPSDEKFGLVSQIKRAAVSILLNLAEGTARNSKKDFARFLTTSLASLVETQAALKLAKSLGCLSMEDWDRLQPMIEKLWYQLYALRKSQQSDNGES